MFAAHKFNFSEQYKKTSRVLLLDKLGSTNINLCPSVGVSYLTIELRELSDFDDSRLIAAMFILRLLSGGRPYISRFGLFQTFYTRAYDVSVYVSVNKFGAETLLTTLSERIFPFLAKADFSKNFLKTTNGILVGMAISDLSFVRVVETHSVFFRWHDKIRIGLNIERGSLAAADLVFNTFKA
jgi:hypothetical protein